MATREEMEATLEELCRKHGVVLPLGPKVQPKAKPRVVTSGGEVIGDADVKVGPADRNAIGGKARTVEVRRTWPRLNHVRIDMAAAEAQREAKLEAQQRNRELDPCRTGIYGRIDDEE